MARRTRRSKGVCWWWWWREEYYDGEQKYVYALTNWLGAWRLKHTSWSWNGSGPESTLSQSPFSRCNKCSTAESRMDPCSRYSCCGIIFDCNACERLSMADVITGAVEAIIALNLFLGRTGDLAVNRGGPVDRRESDGNRNVNKFDKYSSLKLDTF